jgi:dienelactone hydrolase
MKIRIISLVLMICMVLCACNTETSTQTESGSDAKNTSEDMDYKETKVKIGKYDVDGILTIPITDEKCSVVVMVQGSGQSDYNAAPLVDVAMGLAKKGIASIRITKRFYQFPEMYDSTSTVYDEVLDDIYEAIDYVSDNESIDKDKIYLLGHSFGAMLGPKIINEKDSICGFISMAGSARKLEDIILDQNKDYVAGLDLPEEQKKNILQEIEAEVEQIKIADSSSDKMLLGASSKYWRSLNDIDYVALAKNMDVPVLILQGTADIQIYADKDFKELKELYVENGESVLYDGLDHMFLKDKETRVGEDVINDIAEWIKE